MIGMLASFIIFIVAVVIIVLGLQWVMGKVAGTIDPTLKTIIYLFVFLIAFVFFLRLLGVWGGPVEWHLPH